MSLASPQIPVRFKRYGNPSNVLVGAIRWDAWHHQTVDTVRAAMQSSLGPDAYHFRAPFFSVPGSGTISIGGTQANMDSEIAYAVQSGLDYWAFLWYGVSDAMQQAWTYYQSAAQKADIKWCLLFEGFSKLNDEVDNRIATLLTYLAQSNYQTVLTARPLIYILNDGNGNAGKITTLRNACTGAGLGNPYIAVMASGAPSVPAALKTTFGLDAISKYAHGPTTTTEAQFFKLTSVSVQYWLEALALGVDMIPLGMMGWDRRPRIENPVPWEPSQLPGVGMENHYVLPTPEETADAVQLIVDWVAAHPSAVPTNTALLYAWNEHDEGGFINPTYKSASPDSSKASALRRVLV